MDIELREEAEREGDGAWEEEKWRLLAFCTTTVSLGDAGKARDLVFTMYLSTLLRPECF